MRNWGAAQHADEGPSVWKRLRNSVSNLLKRDVPTDEELGVAEPADIIQQDESAAELLSPDAANPDAQPEESFQLEARYTGVDEDADPGLGSAAHAVASRETTPPEDEPTLDTPASNELLIDMSAVGDASTPLEFPDALADVSHEEPKSEADLLFLDADAPAASEPAVAASEPDASSVAPPDDFKFPWSRTAAESTSDAEVVPEPTPVAEQAPRRSSGFLAKLFGRKSREAPVQDVVSNVESAEAPPPAEEVVAEFATPETEHVDETVAPSEGVLSFAPPAVESDEDQRDTGDMDAVKEHDPFEPLESAEERGDDAPGLFGKLFGRRKRDADLEPTASDSPVASSDWTQLDTHGVDAIAPREAPSPSPMDAIAASYSSPDPFEPAAPAPAESAHADFGDTLDAQPIAASQPDFGDTLDAQPNAASQTEFGETLDAPRPAPPSDFGDTLDVVPVAATNPFKPEAGAGTATIDDEISERTDEFAVPEPAAGEVEEDTADLTEEGPPAGFFARLFGRKSRADVAAEAQEVEPGFLHAKFRQFYSEILRFKNQKTQAAAGFATAIVEYAADISPDATAQQRSSRLKELLDLQMTEALWMKGEYAQRYPHAQYAMAALADEIFSEMEWEGQAAWPKYRLEARLFKTNDADLEVFKRIDRLLREETPSAEARDLARVYLLVLASGFRGKWRPFGLKRPIADYRRRLYEFIAESDPLMLYADDHRLMAQAVEYTIEGHAVSRFTAAQRWAVLLVLLVITYVATAHIAWSRVSSDIKDLTARIVSSAARGAP